jgi:hypothetical protein
VFFFDPMYLVIAMPALLLALYAQMKVKTSYQKYLRVPNMRNISGEEAARRLLAESGLSYVNIEGIPGELTDHYDPRSKTLRLSAGVARSRSVAAVGIVAHEVGHAMQDASAYAPMRLRSGLVPAVNLGSWLGPLIFLAGLFLQSPDLAWIGVFLFSGTAVFALVTLPVELDASRRALKMLKVSGLVGGQDAKGAKAVLQAAALTYVAALAQALSTLLYYALLASGMGRSRD